MSRANVLLAGLLVAIAPAVPPPAAAQPLSLYCGSEPMPPPFPLDSGCRWVCAREQLGSPPPWRPAPQRMVWRRHCTYRATDAGLRGPVSARTDVVVRRRGRWVAPGPGPAGVRRRGPQRWLNPQPEPPRPVLRRRGRTWLNPQPEPPRPVLRRGGRTWLNPQPEPPMSPRPGPAVRRRVVAPR